MFAVKVALRTDGPVRRWHDRLGQRLADAGHALVMRRARGRPLPMSLGLALALERRLYGAHGALFEATGEHPSDGDADLVLEVRFDGRFGERALLDALLARRGPRVEIVDAEGRILAAGLPALEQRDVLAHGFDHVLARTEQLVVAAVRSASGEVQVTYIYLVLGETLSF